MIRKIDKIQGFGIFNNFRWDASQIPDFKRHNLIYGWNYSGKTTLSRIFRFFETGQLHKDYEGATFEVEFKDGSKYDQSALKGSFAIRVFNSDFVRENLKWEEGIEPVLLVGEENIELEQQLKKCKANLEEKDKIIRGLWSTVQTEKEKIETGLTGKAREVKNTLLLPDYDKRDIEPIVIDVANAPEANKLTEEQIKRHLQTYRSTDKKETIPEIPLSIPNMDTLWSQIKTLLQKTATGNIIQRLKENPILQKWIREGKELHEGKSHCEFCGNRLPVDLLGKLNAHFSEEYNRLMIEIDQLIHSLKGKKVSLELRDKARFYAELQEEYEKSKENLESAIKAFNDTIEEMIKILETKRTKPFDVVAFERTEDRTGQLKAEIESVDNIIRKHNSKTDKFETERKAAKDELIKHWASEFAIEIKYSETIKEIDEKETEIKVITEEKIETQDEINKIEQKLSDAVKGAEKINEYLHSYFGTDEIKITVAEDDKYFQLERSGHPANNLSEGEKTAIAFSHFMTTMEDKDITSLTDMIVFIDDPVSSLDCNHLFHTYSFIKHILADCKQLFISTHNYEFFNLIKDWRRKGKKYPETSLYLIEKTKNGEDAPFRCNLKALPEPLSKFKSEYVYLFSLLYKFNENPTTDYHYLYILPNLVRRYLEAYVGFRALGGLSRNLSILIEDKTQQGRVYKLINAYSHNSSNPRLLHFPDFSECEGVVNIVLNAVKDKDKNHYYALVEACGNGN